MLQKKKKKIKSKCKNSNVEVTAVFLIHMLQNVQKYSLHLQSYMKLWEKAIVSVVGRVLLDWLCVPFACGALQPLLIFTEGGTYNVQTL